MEKRNKLVTEKNKIHVINDTDKNLGPANADKSDIINKCKRHLFDVATYLKSSKTEMETFLLKSIAKLRMVVEHHLYLGKCSQKKKKRFCFPTFSTMQRHTSALFGKFLKIILWQGIPQTKLTNFVGNSEMELMTLWKILQKMMSVPI